MSGKDFRQTQDEEQEFNSSDECLEDCLGSYNVILEDLDIHFLRLRSASQQKLCATCEHSNKEKAEKCTPKNVLSLRKRAISKESSPIPKKRHIGMSPSEKSLIAKSPIVKSIRKKTAKRTVRKKGSNRTSLTLSRSAARNTAPKTLSKHQDRSNISKDSNESITLGRHTPQAAAHEDVSKDQDTKRSSTGSTLRGRKILQEVLPENVSKDQDTSNSSTGSIMPSGTIRQEVLHKDVSKDQTLAHTSTHTSHTQVVKETASSVTPIRKDKECKKVDNKRKLKGSPSLPYLKAKKPKGPISHTTTGGTTTSCSKSASTRLQTKAAENLKKQKDGKSRKVEETKNIKQKAPSKAKMKAGIRKSSDKTTDSKNEASDNKEAVQSASYVVMSSPFNPDSIVPTSSTVMSSTFNLDTLPSTSNSAMSSASNTTGAVTASNVKDGASSYPMTPPPIVRSPPSSPLSYKISDYLASEDEEEEEYDNYRGKHVPSWSIGLQFKESIIHQFSEDIPNNPDNRSYVEARNIFGELHVSLDEKFGFKSDKYFRKRTSSIIWSCNTSPVDKSCSPTGSSSHTTSPSNSSPICPCVDSAPISIPIHITSCSYSNSSVEDRNAKTPIIISRSSSSSTS